jgi:threonine/homoserine/homoserine lactone efflux protein
MLWFMGEYLLFTFAFLIAAVTPGADTFLILSRAISDRKSALVSGLGITVAKILMVAIAYLGLSALLIGEPGLLIAMKVLGASFLTWRAIRLWNTKERRATAETKGGSFFSAFAIGFSNPQPFAFYLSVIPAVVSTTQLSVLLVIVAIGFGLVTFIYVSMARLLANFLEKGANFQLVNRILAVTFLVLAIVIILR